MFRSWPTPQYYAGGPGHHRGDVYQTTSVSCLPAGQAEQIGPPGRHGVVRFGTGGVPTTLVWPAGHARSWIHPLGSVPALPRANCSKFSPR